eukprot:760749-Hanusia_phi.AAC.3
MDEAHELAANLEEQILLMNRAAKEEINALTMVAQDYVDNEYMCCTVVKSIESCVDKAVNDKKLIPLYVLDSILKNVGGVYNKLILLNLNHTLCNAFQQVDNNVKQKMIKLMNTWSDQKIFSKNVVEKIRHGMMSILQSPSVRNAFEQHSSMQHGFSHMPLGPNYSHMQATGSTNAERFLYSGSGHPSKTIPLVNHNPPFLSAREAFTSFGHLDPNLRSLARGQDLSDPSTSVSHGSLLQTRSTPCSLEYAKAMQNAGNYSHYQGGGICTASHTPFTLQTSSQLAGIKRKLSVKDLSSLLCPLSASFDV